MVKKFKTKNEEINFYDNYVNIIRKEAYSENKEDIILKYTSIDCIVYKKQSYLSLIVIGIIISFFSLIISIGINEAFILIIGLIIAGFFILFYILTLLEIIIIKTPSHQEQILYNTKVYENLISNTDKE